MNSTAAAHTPATTDITMNGGRPANAETSSTTPI